MTIEGVIDDSRAWVEGAAEVLTGDGRIERLTIASAPFAGGFWLGENMAAAGRWMAAITSRSTSGPNNTVTPSNVIRTKSRFAETKHRPALAISIEKSTIDDLLYHK